MRVRRIEIGMTQEALGDQLGVTFQQVQKYERGANRISASRLFFLATALGVPIGFFYEGLVGDGQLPATGPDDGLFGFISSPDGVAIAEAFSRIDSQPIRRRLIDLARTIGGAATKDHPGE
jgi:transcriptional regulator with XRE-family HTH domain